MVIGEMLKKLYQRPVRQFKIGKDTVKDTGEILAVFPEFVIRQKAFITHVVFNLMPALKEYRAELDLKGCINGKIPEFAGI